MEAEVRNPQVIAVPRLNDPPGVTPTERATTLRTSTSCVATIPITAVLVRGHGEPWAPVVEPGVAPIAPACRSRGRASTRAE